MRYQIPLVALIAVITVATIATLGVTGISATNLMPQSTTMDRTSMFMMGHVELILRGSDGEIKNYFQGDNLITNTGDRCVAEMMWPASSTVGAGAEECSGNDFDVIAITNRTDLSPDDNTDISDFTTVATGSGAGGDITATIPDTVITLAATGVGNDVTITNSGHLFNFDVNNATTIEGVLLLDGACAEASDGSCTTVPTANNGEVLAARAATLTVSAGDTLQVTWTITIGGAS